MLKPRVDILLEEYESLKEENQRLKENNQEMQEEMTRTWKKYDEVNNVLNELKKYIKNCIGMECKEMLKQLRINYNNLQKKLDSIKFYIEQSDIKDMLWGKEILKIIEREKK